MEIGARPATAEDVGEVCRLYALLAIEMTDLDDLWSKAAGIAVPVEQAIAASVDDPATCVVVGTIDAVPVGFCLAHPISLQAASPGDQIGLVRYIFTEEPARSVGIGDVMWEAALQLLREMGLDRFDASVPPGHRAAKNFFEQHGFSARSITMHGR